MYPIDAIKVRDNPFSSPSLSYICVYLGYLHTYLGR